MATSTQDPAFTWRLFVDKEKNTVVVAEASRDFVDALFSFLTLPLGTIIRLVSPDIGCINNLYQSVKNSNTQLFWNEICKNMLLCPRNPCEKLCEKLRFNVDDTEHTKYFLEATKYFYCGCSYKDGIFPLSTFAGATCSSCGRVMDKEIKLGEDHFEGDDIFVKHHINYLIFDDLRVHENSPGNTIKQLIHLGYKDFTKLIEISPKVGIKQIKDLLKRALVSKSPLTDVFLAQKDGGSDPISSFRHVLTMAPSQNKNDCSLKLKITMSKSTNKIMYAEAEEDFCDFLFSFLTMPLGCILKQLHHNVALGSVENLYESVMGLCSNITDTRLLDLKVAFQYGCVKQPLELVEEEIPTYSRETLKSSSFKLFDPRSADGRREAAIGFVRRPSLFVVMDDLQVLPLNSTSSILFLQKLSTSLDDLEEHEVKIGTIEALNLLGASLTSKGALTTSLSYLVKKLKKEAN